MEGGLREGPEVIETVEGKNRNLTDEVSNLVDQASKEVQEKQQLQRGKLEVQIALIEAEGARHQEKSKSLCLHLELSQIRAE
ncbi:hypothetical protein FKM82_013415 [Ascaphus truei]